MTAAILLQSCTQTDELMFSCDKGIDNWVKDNISDIQEMSRAEWNKLSYSEQIAVFRAFTPEKKFAFWAEKFEELKQLPWTPAELAHIERERGHCNVTSGGCGLMGGKDCDGTC